MTTLYRGLSELPTDLGPTVLTIGNFDGVHCGHRWVIDRVLERARTLNAKAFAVTLDPHPAQFLRPERDLRLITPQARKLELLSQTGLDGVLVLRFDATLAQTSAHDFAKGVLHEALHAVEVHEGEDFRFGHHAEGSITSLAQLGADLGFRVQAYAQQNLRGYVVSSSRIRTLLTQGKLDHARRLLGRPFSIDSTPARGRGYGTQYAVPTINLAPYDGILPAHGVYVTRLRVGTGQDAVTFDGVTNIGNRPTFGADSFAVETHLFDFHPIALTEETPLRLTFLSRLRDEKRFSLPEDLKTQIGRDIGRAQRFFRRYRAVE
jgi:riboflavin kinase/FMN adenylyltransferase